MNPNRILPMFPLGAVLFPTFSLPLVIFEPRYRRMVSHLGLDAWWDSMTDEQRRSPADRPPVPPAAFGVVLIERGSEVGGGDARFTVGTLARVVDAARVDDRRWAVQVVGENRISVDTWLPDDPFPQAVVHDLEEPHGACTDAGLVERIDDAVRSLRRVLAMASEAGWHAVPATVVLDDDPRVRLWQACGLAPVGPLDDVSMLAAPTLTDRVDVLAQHLEDAQVVLSHRLADG